MAARFQVARSSAASRRILQQFHPRLSTASTFQTLRSRRPFNTSDFEVSALAIAIPKRRYATDTSHPQGSGASGPPPGFNIDEAKKPLPQEESKEAQKEPSPTPTVQDLKDSAEQLHAHSASKPSDIAPTRAASQASLTELALEKAKSDEKQSRLEKADPKQKLTLGQRIMKEVRHYWDG